MEQERFWNMSFTPSKPSDKTSPVSSEKRNRIKSRYFRVVIYIIIAAVCETIFVAAANASSLQKSPLILIVLYSLIPTILLSVAIAIIQAFDEHTDTLEQIIEEYTNETQSQYKSNNDSRIELSKLMDQFKELVDNAGQTLDFYGTHRALLKGDDYKQKKLISSFLKYVMDGPLFVQPMNNLEFFKLHEFGIRQCTIWQAIHQAPISKLGNFQYLSDLQSLKQGDGPSVKQRIVILKQEEVAELYNDEIVAEFLEKTRGTDSFWITDAEFFLHFGVPKLQSAGGALYDGKLLLLRQEEIELGMMSVDYRKDQIHHGFYRAFEELNWSLQHNVQNDFFKKIVRMNADGSSKA